MVDRAKSRGFEVVRRIGEVQEPHHHLLLSVQSMPHDTKQPTTTGSCALSEATNNKSNDDTN